MAAQPVATLDEIPVGTAKQVFVDGEPVCLVRVDLTTVKALHDTCSHQQFSLSEGWIGDGVVECALHGSGFDLTTGAPTSLPAVRPVPTYPVSVIEGSIHVDATAPTNGAPVPRH